MNVGTALLLLAPLAFAERVLSSRVTTAEQRATEARDEAERAQRVVKDLDEALKLRFAVQREKQQSVVDDARSGEQDALVQLFETAAGKDSIDRRGLRVLLEDLGYTLRARAVEREGIKLIEFRIRGRRTDVIPTGDLVAQRARGRGVLATGRQIARHQRLAR